MIASARHALQRLFLAGILLGGAASLSAGDAVVVDAAGNTTVNGALTVVGPLTATGAIRGTAEVDTAGWATYADAAGAAPVDGAGGTATVTWTRTTTTPLEGSASFLFSKDAANRQGQGVAYDFTISDGDREQTFEIAFDVTIASGTYVPGDVQVFIFDRDAGLLIPTPIRNVPGSSTSRKHFLGFFIAGTSLNYRLILHAATATTNAYQLRMDRIAVRPNSQIVTGWQSFTPNIEAVTTNPTKGATREENCRWRRVGHNLEISFFYEHTTAGTSGSGIYRFKLPEGLAADLNLVKPDTGNGVANRSSLVGNGVLTDQAVTADVYQGVVTLFDPTSLAIAGLFSNSTIQSRFAGNGTLTFGNSAFHISFQASVPIAGWEF